MIDEQLDEASLIMLALAGFVEQPNKRCSSLRHTDAKILWNERTRTMLCTMCGRQPLSTYITLSDGFY